MVELIRDNADFATAEASSISSSGFLATWRHWLLKIVGQLRTGYDVLQILVAGVLLTAAVLKAHQLATEPVLGTSLLESRWFLIGVVEFELLFGLWLLSGLLPKATWAAALMCFGLFTCVSLYKALSGHATCGCFGRVPVNPWYTTTLDLATVLSLLRWRPRGLLFSLCELTFARSTVVLAVWLCLGLPGAFAMGSYGPVALVDAGEIVGDGKIVVLEPEKWAGKQFPLLNHIDIGDKLKEGTWLVLLYHHDCPDCKEAIEELPKAVERTGVAQLALVEMPPYGDIGMIPELKVQTRLTVRLDDSKEWFVRAPVEIVLHGGVVEK